MKKKNKMLMIGAVVAAVSLFTVTAMASTSNTAGYDAFKDVLKANHMSGEMIQSATADGNFNIKVDGETVLDAGGTMKVGETGHVSSDFNFTLMGIERNGSLYNNEDNEVYFVDETHNLHYEVVNLDDKNASKHKEWRDKGDFQKRPMTKAEEALLDFVVGDLKDDFDVTNHTDGSKTIILDVSKEEVPLPLRMLVDVASSVDKNKHADNKDVPAEWDRLKQLPFFQGLEGIDVAKQLPELTNEVTIEHVRLQLTVDVNNELQSVQGELEVSGKDEVGVNHHVRMNGGGNFSGINATTPDVYNPAIGKSVEIIDAASFGERR